MSIYHIHSFLHLKQQLLNVVQYAFFVWLLIPSNKKLPERSVAPSKLFYSVRWWHKWNFCVCNPILQCTSNKALSCCLNMIILCLKLREVFCELMHSFPPFLPYYSGSSYLELHSLYPNPVFCTRVRLKTLPKGKQSAQLSTLLPLHHFQQSRSRALSVQI